MPAKVTKTASGDYSVSTPNSVHARHTTLAKAKSQQRLLNAVEHGWKPTGKKCAMCGGSHKATYHVGRGM